MNATERAQLRQCLLHDGADLELTEDDMVIYISPTGNDLCGKGTITQPYLTMERAELDIPVGIAHKVEIRIVGSLTTAERWGLFKRHHFLGAGSLQIYGVGAPEVKAVHGGPHTVTGIASVSTIGQKLTIGAGGLTGKEFRGWFVRVITGGHPGNTFRVVDNGTGTIWINCLPSGDCVHNGDTIEIIRPSVSVALDGYDLNYESESDYFDSVSYACSHMVVANLLLDVSGSTDGMVRIHGTTDEFDGPNLDFVLIESAADLVSFQDVSLNQTPCFDDDYVVESGADVDNMATSDPPGLIVNLANPADVAVFVNGETMLSAVSATGIVQAAWGTIFSFIGSAAELKLWFGSGSIAAMTIGGAAADPAVDVTTGDWDVGINSLGACEYAVKASGGATVRILDGSTCDAVQTSKSGLYLGYGARVFTNDACAGLKGATAGQAAYITQMDAAVKSDNWPAAGVAGYVTDAAGASLLRLA